MFNVFTNIYPDPILHRYISLAKSALRIVAGLCLISGSLFYTGILLIISELLGVLEELV